MPEPSRSRRLPLRVYDQSCITLAAEEFRSLCMIQCRPVEDDVEITITVLPGAPPETPDEFLNFLLCASIEAHLS